MRHDTITSNGHHAPARDEHLVVPERRQVVARGALSPERLIDRQLESARRQLAEAREGLKGARRRVVQLEDAVASWQLFATELRRKRRAAG